MIKAKLEFATGRQIEQWNNDRTEKMYLQQYENGNKVYFYKLTLLQQRGSRFEIYKQIDVLELPQVVSILRGNGDWSLAISRINQIIISRQWQM